MSIDSPPWSQPTAALWAALSSYAPEVRRNKAVAFLRAFTDDSASEIGDRRLFFAGFVHRAEQWALFAEAWDAELKTRPAIKYLKMAEAQNLKKQFRGWDADVRDAKLLSLAHVIAKFRPISFQFSIDRSKFDELYKPHAPRGLASPHFTCCLGVMSGLARFAKERGGNVPIEFIFDEQDGVSIDVQLWFDAIKHSLPRKIQKFIAGTPTFKDDMHVIQLQAADLLAWHVRREHENRDGDSLPPLGLMRRPHEHVFLGEISTEQMVQWAEHHKALPRVKILQSKSQWRKFKVDMAALLSSGFIPPRGTRLKNLIYFIREFFAGLFRAK